MPELSLAIAIKGPWDCAELAGALQAAGAISPRIDIWVACDRPPDKSVDGIKVIVREGVSLFQMWGGLVARCRSPYVAVLHGSAPPAPGWAQAMLASLGSHQALCGPVEPGYPPNDPRITGYLVEYCQFHRPIAQGMNEVPGNNLVLAKAMLGSDACIERDGLSKTRLLGAGEFRAAWVNGAPVLHRRPFELLPFFRRRFRHARSYGATRLAGPGAPPRTILILCTLFLPLLRVSRILRHAWRRPSLRAAVIRRLPAIVAAETCWSAGEFVGYVTAHTGNAALLD